MFSVEGRPCFAAAILCRPPNSPLQNFFPTASIAMFRVYCLTMRCVVALDHFGALDQRALLLSTAAVIAAAIYCSRSCLQHHLAPRTSFQLAAVLVAAVVLAIASGFAIFMLAWFITVALNAALTATSGSVCAAPPLLGWHREPLELTLHKWRYFTVLPCGDGPGARAACLLFNERHYHESSVRAPPPPDGLSFRCEPCVAPTVTPPPARGPRPAGRAVPPTPHSPPPPPRCRPHAQPPSHPPPHP